ncbi:MAG: pilus assembly protein [Bacilli bacterium]|nr:pilus assembly protein [Bacilli bacterium]
MNRKGQALIEFVLILPVLIFVLFSVIDFGIIFSTKNTLENDSVDIVNLFKNGTSLEEIKAMYNNNDINISTDGEYYTFMITTSVNLITPGLNKILGDPYLINVERIVPYA